MRGDEPVGRRFAEFVGELAAHRFPVLNYEKWRRVVQQEAGDVPVHAEQHIHQRIAGKRRQIHDRAGHAPDAAASIVPRCPVFEQRIGQQVSARLRGDHFPWSFGGNHAFPDSQTGLTCLHRSRLSQFGQKWPSGIVSFEIHESEVR